MTRQMTHTNHRQRKEPPCIGGFSRSTAILALLNPNAFPLTFEMNTAVLFQIPGISLFLITYFYEVPIAPP
jgi:hypothetical protein